MSQDCGYDFAQMCRHKQSKLAHNRLSTDRIFSIFGPTGTAIPGVSLLDFNTLIEFATYGITPIVSPSFRAEAVNVAPLRDRYIKLQHTINKLLYKLYSDGTMILLRREDAMRMGGEIIIDSLFFWIKYDERNVLLMMVISIFVHFDG